MKTISEKQLGRKKEISQLRHEASSSAGTPGLKKRHHRNEAKTLSVSISPDSVHLSLCDGSPGGWDRVMLEPVKTNRNRSRTVKRLPLIIY